jgi:hypothetical protein
VGFKLCLTAGFETERPGEYRETLRAPEHRLVAAILGLALRDYAKEQTNPDFIYSRKVGQLTPASSWIWPNDEKETGFTFVWCCRILDLDPTEIRGILKERYPAREKAEIAPVRIYVNSYVECAFNCAGK